MHERVKMFTYVSGHGATLIEPPIEDMINQWLATANGRLVRVTQSESERAGADGSLSVRPRVARPPSELVVALGLIAGHEAAILAEVRKYNRAGGQDPAAPRQLP